MFTSDWAEFLRINHIYLYTIRSGFEINFNQFTDF